MPRIPIVALTETLTGILTRIGFSPDCAAACARLFAETSRDGVDSHGVERFPRFLATIRNSSVDIHALPACIAQAGSIERWDGRRGVGNLNAQTAMARAIALSRTHGIGCVALANTNHWMRGGSYGCQAAEAGVLGICWTNTLANLPPWGAAVPAVGNNPLVFAVPRPDGPIVLDMALSQFSYGALASYRQRNQLLPVDGGFDTEGRLTRDPSAIEASQRPLPIGFWKGSGLAFMLDLFAALLSGGLATCQIPTDPLLETGLSQVFIAIDLAQLQPAEPSAITIHQIVESLLASGDAVRYPGQRMLQLRAENLVQGIPVRDELWAELQTL